MKNISSLKHQGKMLISIFLYLIVYAINGQSVMNILETAPTVTSTESYLYQIYSQLPTSQQNYWVTFASFETAAEDGIIELNLPNLSTTFKMKVTQCEYTNLSEFTWSGMRILETKSDQPASISLTKHLGLLSGEINLFGEFYQIFPINENYQILIKTNTLPTPYEGSINESGDPEPPIVDCSNANGACVINLMILYSLDVELKYINLTPIGFMLANQINNALKNSKISHRINLVAVLPIDDNFPEGNEEQERGLLKHRNE